MEISAKVTDNKSVNLFLK